jgi:UDP-N-acetylmuramate dehydrogenase
MTVSNKVSLFPFNTFGIEAVADCMVQYESEEELEAYIKENSEKKNKFLAVGCGSNLLFLNDFRGTVLNSKIDYVQIAADTPDYVLLQAGGGKRWDDFVEFCVSNSFYGAENLSGIPGTVGASAVQNIGAYGVEVKDIVEKVNTIELATGKHRSFTNPEMKFAYRESILKTSEKGKYIVTSVLYRLSRKENYTQDYAQLHEKVEKLEKSGEMSLPKMRQTIIDIRNKKLPNYRVVGNAGSFFKNPYCCKEHFTALKKRYPEIVHYAVNQDIVKISAAWLIEQCGWKGKIMGQAGVSLNHPLVLVNYGYADGREIAQLAHEIQLSVKQQFSIELETEVEFVK